ncbi:hypothetical protein PGB90_007700 [Kerria lacca]
MDDNKVILITDDKEQNTDNNCVKNNITDEDISSGDGEHQHFENIYNTNSEQDNNNHNVNDERTANFKNNVPCDYGNHIDITPSKIKTEKISKKSKSKLSKKRNKKKKTPWALKFSCSRLKGNNSSTTCSEAEIIKTENEVDSCVCTGYCKTETKILDSNGVPSVECVFQHLQHLEQFEKCQSSEKSQTVESEVEETLKKPDNVCNNTSLVIEPVIDLSKFNPEDYPIEDCDERARLERAREIAEGVDPPPGFSPKQTDLVLQADINMDNWTALFQSALSLSALSQIDVPKSIHSQIDYIHCLVPDLLQITSCSFYWGKMDRYEAERLLENKAEGTFLLRDSAQEEYLFSVSFRKYGRSLHARIEQWNHRFSFDSHDPGVFSSPTVFGLIEHYKDPTCCMFFEPMLTIPLHRNFTFSLQHLCRAIICDQLVYDMINCLKLPKTLKTYLKEYHYKQRVRVRKFDSEP